MDYEGSGYRTDFWEGQGREYEDLTERIALRRLLPANGRRIVHLGAGFGRMTGELGGYDQIFFFAKYPQALAALVMRRQLR